ncbi:MAG: hypothetical protein ACFCUI_12065 [Bernardetiaceae bacterium]
MRLLIVLSLEAYRKDVERIFAAQKISVYSGIDIQGFRPGTSSSFNSWFGSKNTGIYSLMQFAFVPEDQADGLLESIRHHNTAEDLAHPIHAFEMAVSRFV